MGPYPRLLRAYVLSGVAVLAAALGSLLYMETAVIKMSILPTRLEADVTLRGGPSSQNLATTRIEADVTESQQGSASIVQVPPTFATGEVVFACSSACPSAVVIGAGITVATASKIEYRTQDQVTVLRGQSQSVAVRAANPGPAGNTGKGTIHLIIDVHTTGLTVSNPSAITGGADPYTAQVIQQSDFDAVASALLAKVQAELADALKAKAQGQTFVQDGPPTLNLSSDHSVGDHTPTFKITITGSVSAIAFLNSSANALLRAALVQKVPAGYELTSDPIQTTYQVRLATSNGDVTITGTAVGFMSPKLSPSTLRSEIRGMTLDQARKRLQRDAPGSHIDIRIQPVAFWWLPLIPDHIKLTIVVEAAT